MVFFAYGTITLAFPTGFYFFAGGLFDYGTFAFAFQPGFNCFAGGPFCGSSASRFGSLGSLQGGPRLSH